MRTKVIEPTKGSSMILKARPANGALSSAGRVTVSFDPIFVHSTGGMSSGDGRYETTASSRGCTPLFLKADPHSTGTKWNEHVPLRIQVRISSTLGILPSR